MTVRKRKFGKHCSNPRGTLVEWCLLWREPTEINESKTKRHKILFCHAKIWHKIYSKYNIIQILLWFLFQ